MGEVKEIKKKVSHEERRKKKNSCKKRKNTDCSLADKEDGNKSSSIGQLLENGAHLLLLLNPYTIPHSHSFPRVKGDFMTGGKKL